MNRIAARPLNCGVRRATTSRWARVGELLSWAAVLLVATVVVLLVLMDKEVVPDSEPVAAVSFLAGLLAPVFAIVGYGFAKLSGNRVPRVSAMRVLTQQKDMSRLVAVLLVCTFSAAFAQPSPTSLYDRLERQYEELLSAYVAGGVCPARDSEVIQRQRVLASALSEATPSTGPRVLLFAVTANSLENVRRLNEAGASRVGDNGSLLHTAASLADPPMLAYLTSIGFGLEDLGGAGGPALIVAVASNRMDNAKWLIDHGANVNATDTAGGSVLRHSLVCRDQSVVDFLIKAGAVPDAKTNEAAGKLGLR